MSGAFGPSKVFLSFASIINKSLALIFEKCIWFGFIKNSVPESLMAKEKWFATASCIFNLAAQRKAAAKSWRSFK